MEKLTMKSHLLLNPSLPTFDLNRRMFCISIIMILYDLGGLLSCEIMMKVIADKRLT